MLWIGQVLIACALLAWLVVASRRYEHESATAALEEVEVLREQLEALQQRVQNLEAIAAEDERLPAPGDVLRDEVKDDAVSSTVRPRLRS